MTSRENALAQLEQARKYLLGFLPVIRERKLEQALKILMFGLVTYSRHSGILINKERKEFQEMFIKAINIINLDQDLKPILEQALDYVPGQEIMLFHYLATLPALLRKHQEVEQERLAQMKAQERIDRLEKGINLIKNRKFDGGLQHFRRLIRDFPDDAYLNKEIGSLLFNIGHIECIEFLQECTRLAPDDHEAYAMIGTMFRKLKKYQESQDAYKEALSRDPDNVYYLFNLSRTYIDLGKWTDAQEVLEKALKISPNFREAKAALEFATKNMRYCF